MKICYTAADIGYTQDLTDPHGQQQCAGHIIVGETANVRFAGALMYSTSCMDPIGREVAACIPQLLYRYIAYNYGCKEDDTVDQERIEEISSSLLDIFTGNIFGKKQRESVQSEDLLDPETEVLDELNSLARRVNPGYDISYVKYFTIEPGGEPQRITL